MTTPREIDTRAARRAAERATARRLHPDLGGDPEEYIAAMNRLAEKYDAPPKSQDGGSFEGFVHARRWSRLRRRVRRATRGARAAVPSGWPGARKYGQL